MFTCNIFFVIASGIVLVTKAYQITAPSDTGTSGVAWTSAGPNTVSWERVSTDPSSFSVVLVNEDRSVLPTNNQLLASSVDGNILTIAVSPSSAQSFPVGPGFRVNFVKSDSDLNTIYAQSNQFRITPGGSDTNTTRAVDTETSKGPTESLQVPHTTYVAPVQTETVTTVIGSAKVNSLDAVLVGSCLFLSFLSVIV